jgi:hypothetical protein
MLCKYFIYLLALFTILALYWIMTEKEVFFKSLTPAHRIRWLVAFKIAISMIFSNVTVKYFSCGILGIFLYLGIFLCLIIDVFHQFWALFVLIIFSISSCHWRTFEHTLDFSFSHHYVSIFLSYFPSLHLFVMPSEQILLIYPSSY